MMSPYRRNVLVGTTVLGALLVLGWMIIKFSGQLATPFKPKQFTVRFVSDRAEGVAEGSPISFLGVPAGRVTSVTRSNDQLQVFIDASLDQSPPIPANVRAIIRTASALGSGSAIVLEMTAPKPEGQLAQGAQISARYVGLDILPPEFAELARELKMTAQQLREANLIAHVDEQVQKVGKLIDSIQAYTGDEKTRDDLKVAIANLRTTTESASRTTANLEKFSGKLDKLGDQASATITDAQTTIKSANTTLQKTQGNIDQITTQVGDRLLQVSKLLDQFNGIAAKVNEGKGSAGQLVNDPKLYEGLVDVTKQLNLTVTDLRRLVQQWEQEGVSLKLGGK
jgi:phospholipid/cholesterol/gamma-HCH transport system substrate-binding protein